MAWAEKLPSGKYRGVYRDAAGRRRSAGTFPHKAKAERAAAATEAQARRTAAAEADGHKLPWGAWADRWWASRQVEASTLKVDGYRRNAHLAPRWDEVPLGKIRKRDVEEWVGQMRRDGHNAATIRRSVRLLSASLRDAVSADLIGVNPCTGVKLPVEAKHRERFLTREEYLAIRDHLPTTEDRLLVDLLVHTGLRWGEVAGLHWNRVDLERGFLTVVETYSGEGPIKAYPKSRKSRQLPLTPVLVAMLAAHRAEAGDLRAGCATAHAAGTCRSQLVFRRPSNTALRNSNWGGEVWRPAVANAGLTGVHIHDLRHTYASWLLQAGIPLAEVSKLLGHSSMLTTERYAHLASTPNAAVLAALGGGIGTVAPKLPHGQALAIGS